MSNKYPGGIITSGAAAGYSVAFGGTSGFLTSATNAAFTFGTGDFTVEFWCYPISSTGPGGYSYLYAQGPNTTAGFGIYFDGSVFKVWNSSAVISGTTTRSTSNWYHVAVSRSGTSMRLFVNGVQDGSTATNSSNITTGTTYGANIGRWVEISDANYLVGNISNLRVIKGTALYTTTFTPPNQLFNITNTSLLTCNSPAIVDQSSNAFAITANGNSAVSTFTPFTGYTAYNPALGASTPGIWSVSDAIQARQTRRWNMYDPYFQNTTLLLPGNGTNGAQNNTFLDSSSNNFTITRNGNTTQGTFSPFSQTGWSAYLTPNGYASIPTNTGFNFGTSSFTVEFWAFFPSQATKDFLGTYNYTAGVEYGWHFYIDASGKVAFAALNSGGGSVQSLTSATAPTTNTWHHIAFVRNGSSSANLYIDGISVASSTTFTNNISYNGTFWIGGPGLDGNINTPYLYTGYLSNLRVVNGAAVYTSAFTPPTSPLGIFSSGTTVLLTLQNNRFVDNSTTPKTITPFNSISIQAFSPFYPVVAYTPQTIGGSGYFDGSGDYLATPSNTAFSFGTGDFTFECWVYATSTPSDVGIYEGRSNGTTATADGFTLTAFSGSVIRIFSNGVLISSSGTSYINAWCHVAVTRISGTFNLYINGVSQGTSATSRNFTNTDAIIGGGRYSTSGSVTTYFPGYICGVRMVKGQALTTGNFTPPTSPVTTSAVGWTGSNVAGSITGTASLLLNFTNGGIIDATGKNVLETVGNAQISTTQSKFGGSSMYFDGTGDYLANPSSVLYNFGTGDFTIEGWVFLPTGSSGGTILDTRSSDAFVPYDLSVSATLKLDFIYGTSIGQRITSTGSISLNTWTHVAVTRSSGTIRLFIAGTQDGSASYSSAIDASAYPVIGGGRNGAGAGNIGYFYNGYIDDLRITKGVARYIANFTPQTSQWQDQ